MRPTRTATRQISMPSRLKSASSPGSRWQQIRPMHEPGQDDHAPCPDDEGLCPDPLDYLLKMADVRGPDMQHRVGLSRDGPRVDDLRVLGHRSPDASRRGPAAAKR